MKVSELILKLQVLKQDVLVTCSADEELNTVFKDIEIAYLEGEDKIVIWGNPGSEIDF